MDEPPLRELIREKFAAGLLPRVGPTRIWAGPGMGHVCAVCEETICIPNVEIEAEGADGGRRFYHTDCHRTLSSERRRLALKQRLG
jgi:hypothetical protein